MLDALIIGGGPAGLSAALILGRCKRKVLLIDCGKPRNSYSNSLHAFLTRDGIPPAEFIQEARKDLTKYDTIQFKDAEVLKVNKTGQGFMAITEDGHTILARKLLLATGVVDDVPAIKNIMEFYGKSVFLCPYCDGWELSNKALAVYGKGDRGYKLALTLKTWSQDIILCSPPGELDQEQKDHLARNDVSIIEQQITGLEGSQGKLEHIILANGERLRREALFFNTESFIRTRLLEQLGLDYDHQQGVAAGKYEQSQVPGLYVAGNILRQVQLVIVAAAEGAEAAFGINTALSQEDRIK